jgi:AcrR family transcriptional regulator
MKAGKELFWKYGLKRVSVEDVCQEAQVSKMTFYRFFPNKIDLAKAVYDQMVEESMRKFTEIMKSDSPVSEKIKDLIILKLEGTYDISREFLMDIYKTPGTGLKEYIERESARSWHEVLRFFKLAQRKGIFRKDFNPEALLFITKQISILVTDENLLKMYGSPHELIRELTYFFVYGLIETKSV